MINVQIYSIHPSLTPFVRMLWTLDLSFTGEPIDLKMTADCYPHLVIRCENAAEGLWLPGEGTVPIATFKGISLQSKSYKMSANYTHIAVSFFSNGIKNIFGVDAGETTNQLFEASHLLPKEVIEQVVVAASHQERANLLNKVLLRALSQRKKQPDNRIVDFLLNHRGSYNKKLAEYNMSERHFRRLFYRDVGINPNLYRRLYRFEEVMANMRNNRVNSLTDLAYHFGYADQAHFCREFKMFTGESANTFMKKDRVHEDNGVVDRPDGIGHLIGASL